MRKLREIIRLKLQAGQSGRAIARSCGLSPSTVAEYAGRIALAGLSWPLAPELDDDTALERLLFPDEHRPVSNRPEPDWAWIHTELQRRHVTKMLLWQEYKEAQPGGLQYSQFCDRYLRWARPLSATMRQAHRAGEKTFIDFSGDGLDVVNAFTGECQKAVLFVAVLGASNLTYVEPVLHQDLPTWIGCVQLLEQRRHGRPELLDRRFSCSVKAVRREGAVRAGMEPTEQPAWRGGEPCSGSCDRDPLRGERNLTHGGPLERVDPNNDGAREERARDGGPVRKDAHDRGIVKLRQCRRPARQACAHTFKRDPEEPERPPRLQDHRRDFAVSIGLVVAGLAPDPQFLRQLVGPKEIGERYEPVADGPARSLVGPARAHQGQVPVGAVEPAEPGEPRDDIQDHLANSDCAVASVVCARLGLCQGKSVRCFRDEAALHQAGEDSQGIEQGRDREKPDHETGTAALRLYGRDEIHVPPLSFALRY